MYNCNKGETRFGRMILGDELNKPLIYLTLNVDHKSTTTYRPPIFFFLFKFLKFLSHNFLILRAPEDYDLELIRITCDYKSSES